MTGLGIAAVFKPANRELVSAQITYSPDSIGKKRSQSNVSDSRGMAFPLGGNPGGGPVCPAGADRHGRYPAEEKRCARRAGLDRHGLAGADFRLAALLPVRDQPGDAARPEIG